MKKTALLLIDIQNGFKDSSWGPRNNPEFESNVRRVLTFFREKKLPVLHVQHHSKKPNSPLRSNQPGVEFMSEARPLSAEPIFRKNVHSAFIGTELESYLRKNEISHIVIIGLCTDHCISTTARMAYDLGFEVTILSDTTASFDRKTFQGKTISADVIHETALASLHEEFATVTDSTNFQRNFL